MTIIPIRVAENGGTVPMIVAENGGTVPLDVEQVRVVGRGNAYLYINTTAEWNSKPTYIPRRGEIIVYSDHDTVIEDGEEKLVPGIKIGDGMAYCIDLPFVTDALAKRLLGHINNSAIHVSAEDRAFWDNKLNCDVGG